MFNQFKERFCRWTGLNEPMKSHRRATATERNAIQISVFASRMIEIGKMLIYAGILALIAASLINDSPKLLAAIATLVGGTTAFGIGIFATGRYVEEKQEAPKVVVVDLARKRRRRKRR